MTINKSKLLLYAVMAFGLYLGVQNIYLWIKGIEYSPVQSVFHVKPKPVKIAPQAPRNGERVVTLPCVPLKVIQPVKTPVVASEGLSIKPQAFTIGRWDIPFSRKGGVAEVAVDRNTGESSLTFTPKDIGIVEMGRARYLTLWANYGVILSDKLSREMSVNLEYQQDAFRLGLVWTRVHGGLYLGNKTLSTGEKINDAGVYVGVGLGVGL